MGTLYGSLLLLLLVVLLLSFSPTESEGFRLLARGSSSRRLQFGGRYIPPANRNDTTLQGWESQAAALTRPTADLAVSNLPPSTAKGRPCVVLDIGANVGTFTGQVSSMRPDCAIYAFEPVAELFSYTKDKFQGNPKVTVVHAALCKEPRTDTIYRNTTGNKGWNTLSDQHGESSPTMIREEITCLRFDDFASSLAGEGRPLPGPPGFVKIDVEGAEWEVFRGMHHELEAWKTQGPLPVMAIEIGFGAATHPHWAEEASEFEWLFAHGYERIHYEVPTTTDVVLRPIP